MARVSVHPGASAVRGCGRNSHLEHDMASLGERVSWASGPRALPGGLGQHGRRRGAGQGRQGRAGPWDSHRSGLVCGTSPRWWDRSSRSTRCGQTGLGGRVSLDAPMPGQEERGLVRARGGGCNEARGNHLTGQTALANATCKQGPVRWACTWQGMESEAGGGRGGNGSAAAAAAATTTNLLPRRRRGARG